MLGRINHLHTAVAICAALAAAPGCILDDPSISESDELQAGTRTSQLWGDGGERWSPTSRLPDYSFAGYRAGARTIPDVAVVANVKDFGARGDGSRDDTAAFREALRQTRDGALRVPAGRYKLSGQLVIDASRVVLRGAGEGKTTLLFTRPVPEENGEVPYAGGMIVVRGSIGGSKVTDVAAGAKRGARKLKVSSAADLKAGDRVRLRMKNPADNSLGCHLYADAGCLNESRQSWYGGNIVDWAVKIKKVDGDTIVLERPLRLDVRTKWNPQLWRHAPTVREVGIEDLTVEFPDEAYRGHHQEAGYYGIMLEDTVDSWVRRVTVVDADRGVGLFGAAFTTVSDVTLTTDARTGAPIGHYGFNVSGPRGQDNLFTRCALTGDFVHNLAVQSFASGNVYSEIAVPSPIFDHHGGAPYENLYTAITLEASGQDFFKSGGNRTDEPNGARTTVWNVDKRGGSFGGFRPEDKIPAANLVGVDALGTSRPSHTSTGRWVEKWRGPDTHPGNLHEAQFERRTGKDFPQ